MKKLTVLLVIMVAGLAICEATLLKKLFGSDNSQDDSKVIGPPDLDALDEYLRTHINSDDIERNAELLINNLKKITHRRLWSAALIVVSLAQGKGKCYHNVREALNNAAYAGAKLNGTRRVDKVLSYYMGPAISVCQESMEQSIDKMMSSSSQVAKLVRLGKSDPEPPTDADQGRLMDVYYLLKSMEGEDADRDHYNSVGGLYSFDHEMFAGALNKSLMPACRELFNQMLDTHTTVSAIKKIMKGTQPDPFDGPKFNLLKQALWANTVCKYADPWESKDTTKLTEQLNQNRGS